MSACGNKDLPLFATFSYFKESLSSFVGMWKDRDITTETLREAAWKK